jgi:rhodanese-related sulfurtransferase
MIRPTTSAGSRRYWGWIGLSLVLLCGLTGCNVSTDDSKIQLISVGEARRLWQDSQSGASPDGLLLVDPRPATAFANRHIPGARNVHLEEVQPKAGRSAEFERYRRIVVYGDNPGSPAARGLVKRFIANSYDRVYLMDGGLDEWVRQGGKVQSADQP